MRFSPRLLVPVLAFAAIAGTLAACGGGDDDCCDDIESYFERIDEIDDKRRDDFVEFNRQIDVTFAGSSGLTDENRPALIAAFTRGEEILQEIVVLLQDILPPAEVEELHEEMIEGHREFRQSFATFKTRIPNIQTDEDITNAVAGYATAGLRSRLACQELQKYADENDIDVTLDCGIVVE
jgi:hypothetical protein